MDQMALTAKVKLDLSDEQKRLLSDTMDAYTRACNFVSDYIFRTHNLKQVPLHRELYSLLRSKFSLRSQMAGSVLKTVIARYKTIFSNQKKWIQPEFRKSQYDLVWNRDYSLKKGTFSVNTLKGREKARYFSKGMEEYLNPALYKFGTAKLVRYKDKYFLHIPVTFEINGCAESEVRNVVGIDRGINFIAVSYDSNHKSRFWRGRNLKQKRASFASVRKQLQERGTASSRRRLKAIGNREHRWMQDVNHCVSKALVTQNPKNSLFVLEDLSGIRKATEKVRRKSRYVTVSWAFFDLEQKIVYKAQRYGSLVLKVNPRYTSQCCPICGHTERGNRDKRSHSFCCKNCGYKSNDDRIGAMNLHRMGISYLSKETPKEEIIDSGSYSPVEISEAVLLRAVAEEHGSSAKGAVNHPAMQRHAPSEERQKIGENQ